MSRSPGHRLRALALAAVSFFPIALPAAGVDASAPRAVDRLPASLAGTWEFALGDPIDGLHGVERLPWRPVHVPGSWQDAGIPGHGTGWYRLRFALAPSVAARPLAFATSQIRDADEVYLDGLFVGRTGAFPPSYDKGTLVARVYELPASRTSIAGPHELLVRVHNPGPRGGGITGEPFLDSVAAAITGRTSREAPTAILSAMLAALGLFALLLFLRDRRQVDSLYFFLLSAGFSLFAGTWVSAWTAGPFRLSTVVRVNFSLCFGLVGIFVLFFRHFFGRPLRAHHRLFLALLGAGALGCLLLPRVDDLYYLLPAAYVFWSAAMLEAVATLIRDARAHVRYAGSILGGAVLLSAGTLFDIGQDLGIFGDPVGYTRLAGPSFLVFSAIVLASLADRFAELKVAASTDPLTGLANRSTLFERTALELARARRTHEPLTLAMLDLDHFKTFNDRFGHVPGDRLLVAVSEVLVDSIRATDLAARYGGEEFVLVLPEAGTVESVVCLERIRTAISEIRIPGAEDRITTSIGVAVYDPDAQGVVSPTALVRQADAALYEAKATGRDRVAVAKGSPSPGSSGSIPIDSLRERIARLRKRPGGRG